jgi:excisionase family DNA binding protein
MLVKKDVAKFLGVTIRTVENLMARKNLPHYRLSRRKVLFRQQDVVQWLEERFKMYG